MSVNWINFGRKCWLVCPLPCNSQLLTYLFENKLGSFCWRQHVEIESCMTLPNVIKGSHLTFCKIGLHEWLFNWWCWFHSLFKDASKILMEIGVRFIMLNMLLRLKYACFYFWSCNFRARTQLLLLTLDVFVIYLKSCRLARVHIVVYTEHVTWRQTK